MFKQRILLRFSKKGLLRFISHRDLMALLERAFRRARVPLVLSQGFNPRPRISFPLALGLGVQGCREVLEVQLQGWSNPPRLVETLQAVLPEGVAIQGFEYCHGGKFKACRASYRIELPQPPSDTERKQLTDLNQRTTIPVTRCRPDKPDRNIDLRPFLDQVCIDRDGSIRFEAVVTPDGTLRPQEVLQAAGVPWSSAVRMTRTDVWGH